MRRKSKKYYAIVAFAAVLILMSSAIAKQLVKEPPQYSQNEYQTANQENAQFNHENSLLSTKDDVPTVHLNAEEFTFETRVALPSATQTNLDRYTQLVTQDNGGTFDIILTNRGGDTHYLLQVSSLSEKTCQSDDTRACAAGAALARGNIAEIQLTLPGTKLKPGNYPLAAGGTTPRDEVITYSNQLYSDPSHGRVGCQLWGDGTLSVHTADYDAGGNLAYFEASLVRTCDQTSPFLLATPGDNTQQADLGNIESYVYHSAWRCRLKAVGENPISSIN
ncbi:MAG: hypothetical protein KME47_16705 [Nodosilinea sp. WJT8-NPBG4]|jgi:hypothetical protein|nr:hypothetical protein [Nodosilinea sp. WJT8-NPBG4]